LSAPAPPPPDLDPKRRTRARFLYPLALIVIAIAALAVFESLRHSEPAPPAPHEPSLALIAPPQPPAAQPPEAPAPPPPPAVVNEPDAAPPASQPARQSLPDNTAYLVQAGVFTSTANAQALQQRLAKAGVRAKVETRVQLGPYKDRRDAEQALAKLRKLGVNAVMMPAR
jgi:DedD protein